MTDGTQQEIRITLKEVWAAQQEQGKMLIEMSGDLKRFLDSHGRLDTTVNDHESRLRSLEKLIWTAAGMGSIVGAAIGIVVNLLLK